MSVKDKVVLEAVPEAVPEAPQAAGRPGDLLDRLSHPARKKTKKGDTLHVMFTVQGDDAHTLRAMFAEAGIENISAYVKGLVAWDLRARLNGNQSNR